VELVVLASYRRQPVLEVALWSPGSTTRQPIKAAPVGPWMDPQWGAIKGGGISIPASSPPSLTPTAKPFPLSSVWAGVSAHAAGSLTQLLFPSTRLLLRFRDIVLHTTLQLSSILDNFLINRLSDNLTPPPPPHPKFPNQADPITVRDEHHLLNR
jgi:hypothetical protein